MSARRNSATRRANSVPAPWYRQRRLYVGLGVVLMLVGLCGRPVMAWLNRTTPEELRLGRELFEHRWTEGDPLAGKGDGLGPLFNAKSCAECHFQGGLGGGGPNQHNVQAFETLPTPARLQPTSGVVHRFATQPEFFESLEHVRSLFPRVPKGVTVRGTCFVVKETFDPVVTHSVNTPSLFGLGAIDEISSSSFRIHAAQRSVDTMAREFQLDFDGTPPGRVRVLPDGRIGKFGWKAQFATLEEFVAAACAMELGLSNPLKSPPLPRTFEAGKKAEWDLDNRQLRAMVRYVASLPPPKETAAASDLADGVSRGKQVFHSVGCTACHVPNFGGVKGLYSDLCLYTISDGDGNDGYIREPQIPLPDDAPKPHEWKTPPLWGVADTAPYLHDGSANTLEEAIQAHGGQANGVRKRYRALDEPSRAALLEFLKSLSNRP